VVCYDGETGKEIWEQGLPSRFFEGLGGLGPRSTPALQGQYLYTLGAEGWLRKLDARNGQVVWKVDLRNEAAMEIPPMWGYSASPLVYADKVVVHAGGKEGKGVLAFNDNDGTLAWCTASGKDSYGSVQVITLLDKKYLCLLSEQGAHLWEPETGKLVYDYQWPHSGYRSLQPQVIDGNKLLVGTGLGSGTRLVQFKETDGEIATEEVWTSLNMKPDFNDFLVHKGHLYGFDNLIFACVDLSDGKRKWKGGRYDKGQALLLADSDLIVVVTEKGELVLLRTNPEKLEEIFKIQALEGKTWNHPIVVGDKLYLRNAKEAVCFQLPIQAGSQ
jgi:outer membrane protein assembly factor BamB